MTIQDDAWPFMTNIRTLYLESEDPNLATKLTGLNQLTSLAVHKSSQPVLEALMASNATFLANLLYVDLSHSKIATLDQVTLSASCARLAQLSLSGNSLKVIKPEWFAGLTRLNELDLSNNLIESLDDPNTFVD